MSTTYFDLSSSLPCIGLLPRLLHTDDRQELYRGDRFNLQPNYSFSLAPSATEAEPNPAPYFVHLIDELTPEQRDRLIALTRATTDEIELDGDQKRFWNLEQYTAWLQKGRTVFAMTNSISPSSKLYGIVWLGEEQLPADRVYLPSVNIAVYTHTLAIRIYEEARRRNMGVGFESGTVDIYHNVLGLTKGGLLWVKTHEANIASLKTDRRAGFTRVLSEPTKADPTYILGFAA